jgi:long-chain acyl-CoA synthetase
VVVPVWIGARVVVGDVRERRTRELLPRCRPTLLVGVPRVFESMLSSVESAADRAGRLRLLNACRALSRGLKRATGLNAGKLIFRGLHRRLFGGNQLRFCVSGGARISPRLLRELFALGIPVVQGWGMSELSPVAAVQPFRRARFYLTRHYERRAGSIGRELDGTAVSLRPPPGGELLDDGEERGEMVVAGPHVMKGYHRDPERTRRQMTPRGLRSGDVARRDADGDLYVIGRIKHVIVLPNGKKIFPEQDLHEELAGCPSVESFAVRAVTGGRQPGAEEAGDEKIGILVRPNLENLRARGVRTVGQTYEAIKEDINRSLAGKPSYLRQYDFCLTEWCDGQFAELVNSSLGEPSPLRNPFTPETAYSRNRGSDEPAPWAPESESD